MKVNVHRSDGLAVIDISYSSFAMNADGHDQYSNIFSPASPAPLRETYLTYDDEKFVSHGGTETKRSSPTFNF